MSLWRVGAFVWISSFAVSASRAVAQTASAKLYYPPCARFAAEYTFDCYHNYAEVTDFLRAATDAHPQLARMESLGQSYEGRDIWVVTITDFSAGPPEGKPGIWVDGGIDADEVIASEAALGLVHRLLTSKDSTVRELLRTRVFYVAPVVIPDASELHHNTPERPRDTTLRPWDDDGDGEADEDGVEDLDGDDQALQMRQMDRSGRMVIDERDPRLMRSRRPGDRGPFYRVYLEGIDNDEDGEYQEDRLGGIDPNRNFPGNWSLEQGGSGPFAGSELELRAMLDFILAHPNIAASQHFHSSGGVVLHPPSVPDFELPAADQSLYLGLSRLGLEVTGYDLATSVYDWNWPSGSGNRKRGQVYRNAEGDVRGWPLGTGDAYPAYGGSIDGFYSLFGILAFANEIYRMGPDTDGDGQVDAVEQLRFDDDSLGGVAFKEWTAFDHPQLGPVEIGGWRKFGQNNPIGERIAVEVDRNVRFALMQAEHTPRLVIEGVDTEDLGGGIRRISATVRNTGTQPTELAIRRQQNRAVPVRARLSFNGNVEILSRMPTVDLGILAGYAQREAEWLIRVTGNATVTVVATHPKAGMVRSSMTF